MYEEQHFNMGWQVADIYVVLPVFLAALSFTIYWFAAKSEKIKTWFQQKYEPDRASVFHITFNRFLGFVVMGAIPLALVLLIIPAQSLESLGLGFRTEKIWFSLAWTAGLSMILVPMAMMSARKPKNLRNYPQIRARQWSRWTIIINIIGWAIYLLGYEILFRGVLLIPMAGQIGIWPAIAVNIALYSATHIPKGLEETIGAIPLGIVLCILTLLSGSIWIAFCVHLVMALTNSFTAFKYHPEMHFKK